MPITCSENDEQRFLAVVDWMLKTFSLAPATHLSAADMIYEHGRNHHEDVSPPMLEKYQSVPPNNRPIIL